MKAILSRLLQQALFRHKRVQVDPLFDQRLQRLGTREGLRSVQAGPFRLRRARPEA